MKLLQRRQTLPHRQTWDKFHLSKHDPAECYGLTADKKDAKTMLAEGIARLAELQERLYAEDRWSVLIVLQAMDAAAG